MKKWIALLGFLLVMAIFAALFQDSAKASLAIGLGAVAKTALDEALEIPQGEHDAQDN